MPERIKPCGVDILACLFCFAGLFFPTFLLEKANRLMPGDSVSAFYPLGVWSVIIIVATFILVLFSGKLNFAYGNVLRLSAVSTVLVYVTVSSAFFASNVMEESSYARVSFSTGYWLLFLGCMLLYLQAYTTEKRQSIRFLYTSIIFIPLAVIVFSGFIDSMSVMQEYINYAERFKKEIVVHLMISVGSILLACLAGVPLGIFSAKRDSAGSGIFDVLNIVQTIPSIALFGLLMAPLAWLATNSAMLKSAGISGIGWAPAVIALFLYSLLPIVRNTYEGVKNIDDGVREAARGMGMTSMYMLVKVELPLTMPVILNGIRVALVQSIGNTAVVSLIGAGGMGIFIFQGLGQSAVPLIMLGTIPTIVLAVLADSIMQLTISLSKGAHNDRT
ncbi:MAG: ABC transporter permease [Denitrovibrio sp.]|nr:MAG: ABC transporter permease [Denitrovibrio sp.]